MSPHAPFELTCPKCGKEFQGTVYIIPGSLGTIYEYEKAFCINCGKSFTPKQVQVMTGDINNENQEPIELYAEGETARAFWEVQQRTYPKNFIRRPFRWKKS